MANVDRPGPSEQEQGVDSQDAEMLEKARRARGEKEPPISRHDITCLEDLAALHGNFIKYTRDNGETWSYARLWNNLQQLEASDGRMILGFRADTERGSGSRQLDTLTERDFGMNKLVVRPVRPEEMRDVDLSRRR